MPSGAGAIAGEVEPEEVLSDPHEIAVGEGRVPPHGEVGAVRRAHVLDGKGARRRVTPDDAVAARHEGVVGEYEVARFAPDDRLVPVEVEHVSRYPLDGPLGKARVPGQGGGPEE